MTIRLLALSALFALLPFTAMADAPTIVVDGKVHVEYDVDVEIDDMGDLGDAYDLNINQFNHYSPQIVDIDVKYNNNITEDLVIDGTAVGNNVNVETDVPYYDTFDGSIIQGNQDWSEQVVTIDVLRNTLEAGLFIDGIAVGNNANVELTSGDLSLDVLQYNMDSGQLVDINVEGNSFGWYPIDPDLTGTAVGNNLNIELAGDIADINVLQSNENSASVVDIDFNSNWGNIGPVNIDATAVGNNASIGEIEF